MKYSSETIPDIIEAGVKKNTTGKFSAVKRNGEWIETSIEDFKNKAKFLGLGLYELGVRKGDRVSVHSENSTEWLICDQATLSIGGVNVAVYTTQPGDQIKYILENSEAKVHIVSNEELFAETKPLIKEIKTVQAIISIQPTSHEQVKGFEEVIELGKKLDEKEPGLYDRLKSEIEPEDLANINYTSGTTGVPKGVMLTHKNIASNVLGSFQCMPFVEKMPHDPKVLSFLPLAHMLERIASYVYIFTGVPIYYIEDVNDIRTDFVTIKPIYFSTVPRLLEKIMAGIKVKGQELSGAKKRLYYWSIHLAENYDPENPPKGIDKLRFKVADKLVYSKVRDGLGGRLMGMAVGGAALSEPVMRFFNGVGFKCGQGYGLTETSPVLTGSKADWIRIGSAGLPIDEVELKIAEDGEVLAKGPNIMKGYYKMPEKTAEVFTEDGWFCTGDIGHIDEDGWLFITDRKKSLFKLSTGKYVAPQPIENALINSGFIDQAMVVGSEQKFCAAIIIPDWKNMEKRFERFGYILPGEKKIESEHVISRIQKEVDKVNKKLPHWEKVKKFVLLEEPFTIEKGELTAKMSVRRSGVMRNHKELIESIYQD